jgi:hypothetical protein
MPEKRCKPCVGLLFSVPPLCKGRLGGVEAFRHDSPRRSSPERFLLLGKPSTSPSPLLTKEGKVEIVSELVNIYNYEIVIRK